MGSLCLFGGFHGIVLASSKEDEVYEIAQRLRIGLTPQNLRLRKEYTAVGLKVFSVRGKEGYNVFGSKGRPVCRVSQIEIGANMEEVILLLEDPTIRSVYDPDHCVESRAIKSSSSGSYVRGRAGWLIPARDFCAERFKLSPAIVGINNFQSVVFLFKDASALMPSSWQAWRGKANTIVVLEPLSPTRVLITYLIEADVGGYASWLDRSTVDFVVGDSLVMWLVGLKTHVESRGKETENMTIEEAARMRFQRKQKQEASASLLDDLDTVGVTKENIKETILMLERKLVDIGNKERQDNLDLSALKNKIREDLASLRQKHTQHT